VRSARNEAALDGLSNGHGNRILEARGAAFAEALAFQRRKGLFVGEMGGYVRNLVTEVRNKHYRRLTEIY